jgi:hypothetical protein
LETVLIHKHHARLSPRLTLAPPLAVRCTVSERVDGDGVALIYRPYLLLGRVTRHEFKSAMHFLGGYDVCVSIFVAS